MDKRLLQFKKALNGIAEVGWQEESTTSYIQKMLKTTPLKRGFGGKNVGLLYKVGKGKKAILLRADIDALKTQAGIKHTCGHSSHTAALMDAFLKRHEVIQKSLKTIYFLFQPAEETYPSGAKAFLDNCQNIMHTVSFAFAAHVRPKLPLGELGLASVVLGRGDYMEIEVHGKMVHVKNTPQGIDALEAAAHIVLFVRKLQKKYKKHLRINIGVASSGLQPNAVPDYAMLKGDIRMKDNKYQSIVKQLLQNKLQELEKTLGVRTNFRYFDGYPPLVNDRKLLREVATYIGKTTSLRPSFNDELFTFGSEDFSFIANTVPSVYVLVGTGDDHDIHEENCTISDKGTEYISTYFTSVIDWWLQQ
ncbi:MAG: amidohydrolase [Candidatus Levybacteria bacterium]|nr:amidohydrolase [Candidatus Levybacteria bacterium]